MKLADQIFDIATKTEPLSNRDKAILAWTAGQLDAMPMSGPSEELIRILLSKLEED